MPLPFDATLKELGQDSPRQFLTALGVPPAGPVALLNVDLSKAQQSSDWGASQLTPEQVSYAASDVTSLHALRNKLDVMLAREGRMELAQACFDFLPQRAALDLAGWPDVDIFAHS